MGRGVSVGIGTGDRVGVGMVMGTEGIRREVDMEGRRGCGRRLRRVVYCPAIYSRGAGLLTERTGIRKRLQDGGVDSEIFIGIL